MQLFDRPAVRDKSARKVVQQFRMRGRLTSLSEVVDRAYESLPKVMLPDPVDHHASDKRIVRPRHLLGERKPSAAFRRSGLLFVSSYHTQEATRDLIAR